tara:strand:+ start:981 stop:1172 length:192 start_codon:yes stop_codon:yes gene_type:complete
MVITYGYIGFKGEYYDMTNTLKGMKISATRRGITSIYQRCGYVVTKVSEKLDGKWHDINRENI